MHRGRRFYQGGQEPMLFLGLAYCGYCGKRLIRGTGCRQRLRSIESELGGWRKNQATMDVLHGFIKRIDVRGTNDVSITYYFSSADKSEMHSGLLAPIAPNP